MKKRNHVIKAFTVIGCYLLAACTNEEFIDPSKEDNFTDGTPYITKVLEYCPAPGQFVNTMPEYEEGDTEETMKAKVLEAIGNNNRGLITLGGFGGYITVGFDHTIENKPSMRDFRILGNSFAAAGGVTQDGSCEAGVIQVAYDANKNGTADADEWYEIAGSAHSGTESWYETVKEAGNDTNLYPDYEMTYYRPETEEYAPLEEYIRWEANQGIVKAGYKAKNQYHKQPYYPQWITDNKMIFKGTCLPQNGMDKSGQGTNYIQYQFAYGYADNAANNTDGSTIDIDWAIDKEGNPVQLPGVDFIRIHTGVNQENGWLGECSTEIMGIEDLHLLNQENN